MIDHLLQPGTPAPIAWTALLLAAFIIGLAKSGFGGGIGILAVPLVANVLRADHAVGVMLPVLIGADLVAFAQHRRNRSDAHLKPALAGATLGVLAGFGVLWWLQPPGSDAQGAARLAGVLKPLVGGITLAMVGIQVYRWLGGRVPPMSSARRVAVPVGVLAGTASTLAHSAGPIMTVYWLDAKLAKPVLVATLVVFFLLVNLIKVPGYVVWGLIGTHTLALSGVMLAAVPIGSFLGLWLHKRIPDRPFALIMYVAAAAAGGRLLWQTVFA